MVFWFTKVLTIIDFCVAIFINDVEKLIVIYVNRKDYEDQDTIFFTYLNLSKKLSLDEFTIFPRKTLLCHSCPKNNINDSNYSFVIPGTSTRKGYITRTDVGAIN